MGSHPFFGVPLEDAPRLDRIDQRYLCLALADLDAYPQRLPPVRRRDDTARRADDLSLRFFYRAPFCHRLGFTTIQ
jgi:hypothetical protein